jgi:hypothetical protein
VCERERERECSTSVDGAELKIASLPLRFLPCAVKTKRRSERDEYLPRASESEAS